jgi:inosine-uridine nucleoside N-ribohydrolase
MGGSITGGNVNASAEANIYNDPEAAQIVFQAGWPLTMVGLDVGDKTLFSSKQLAQLGQTHGPMNDFMGVARGEFTRGETVANRHGAFERNVLHGDRYLIEGVDKVEPNAKVCVDVDADRFLQLFVSRIRGK